MFDIDLLNLTNNDKWIIYTKSNCVYCDKVKKILEKEEIVSIINCDNMLKNQEKKEMFLNSIKEIVGFEWKTFPIVFLNNKFIGGYNDVEKYINQNNKELIIDEDF